MPTRGAWEGFIGDPPAAFTRVVQWQNFAAIENFASANIAFVETPVSAEYSGGDEASYVGSRTYSSGREVDINRPVNNLYLLSDRSRMFNGNALATNFLRTNYPGMGSIDKWIDKKDGPTVNHTLLDNLLLTSTTHGRYTSTNNNIGTIEPRQFGVTFRLDF